MHIYVKIPRSSLLDKEGFFMEMYRATARQRGNSFPSCAWRISQLHRDFSLAFALDFLDLTTFLRQILGKIYSSDFLTTFYDNNLSSAIFYTPLDAFFFSDIRICYIHIKKASFIYFVIFLQRTVCIKKFMVCRN